MRGTKKVFTDVVHAYEEALMGLGKSVATDFLYITALQTLQHYYEPDRRLREHLLLLWRSGWSKSYFIDSFYELLGPDLSLKLVDVNHAVLTGTAESSEFIPPAVLDRRFLLVSEFASTLKNDDENTKNALLELLESGEYERRLAKFTKVKRVTNKYVGKSGVGVWLTPTRFKYKTDFALIAATYPSSSKYFTDEAMLSRFYIVRGDKHLSEELAATMKKVHFSNTLIKDFRFYMENPPAVDLKVTIPEGFMKSLKGLTPRERFTVLEPFVIARRFWDLPTSLTDLLALHLEYIQRQSAVTTEEVILTAVNGGMKTAREIMQSTGLSLPTVYRVLKKTGMFDSVRKNKRVYWKVSDVLNQ